MSSVLSCSLCSFTCDEFESLFDGSGQKSEVYHIAVKYFSPLLLESGVGTSLKVICTECWQHISDFHSFQKWIINAQVEQEDVKLIKQEQISDDEEMSNFGNVDLKDATGAIATKSTDSIKSIINSSETNHDNEKNSDTCEKDFISKFNGKFKCNKCKELFSSYLTLEAHFDRFHSNDQSYFPSRKNENSFKCDTCGATFTLKGNLRRHIRRKHTVQPLYKWVCKYCNKMFKIQQELENHKYKTHNSELTNDEDDDIPQNTKRLKRENVKNFVIYSESSDEINANSMNENIIYNSNDSAGGHLENNTRNNGKSVTLDLSSSNVQNSPSPLQIDVPPLDIIDIKPEISSDTGSESDTNNLSRNMYTIELNPTKEEKEQDEHIAKWLGDLECPKCNKYEKFYAQLNKHFATDHPEERCYIICCQIVLHQRINIIEHLQIHSNPNAFECNDCGKCFKNSRGLNSHKLQVHSDNRSEYHLNECCCKKSKELTYDPKSKHIEYDTVICCQRKKKVLENDSLIAEWKKELICQICDDKFSYYSLMRAHFFREHPGEKCYILCCQRKICRISDAVDHIRFHLDPHAYRCKICNIIFSCRSSLAKHMRNIHSDSLPKHQWACDECDKTFEIRQILIRHKNVFHTKQD